MVSSLMLSMTATSVAVFAPPNTRGIWGYPGLRLQGHKGLVVL